MQSQHESVQPSRPAIMATEDADRDRDYHLGAYPCCGICADDIFQHERVIAIFGNEDSTSYRGHTRPFVYPHLGYSMTRVDGYRLCRHPQCYSCTHSPESIAIHHDCFEIFRQRCLASDPLGRLWVVAAWRSPWRRAQPIYFPSPAVDISILSTISHLSGLPLLHTLPPELLEIIRNYSPHALLWRCISALQLAARISATASQPLVTIPLTDLHSWSRNGTLQLVSKSKSSLPILRFTIDSAGISKVERLAGPPPQYAGHCTRRSAFIVTQDESASGVVVQLKDGCARLLFPERPSFRIWNTPAPPNLALCRASPRYSRQCQNFYAVEMSKISGITFLFRGRRLDAIHVHYLADSCALDTCTRISSKRTQRHVVWIYLPISRVDPPTYLGVRVWTQSRVRSIIVQTKLSGDVIIGAQSKGQFSDGSLGASPPLTMLYAEPKPAESIAFFGAYCRVPEEKGRPGPPPPRIPSSAGCPMGDDAYFSWAPLSGISSTLVFYDAKNGACRGILFYYGNGAVRAVGQCRLQVDPATEVHQPVRVCFRVEKRPALCSPFEEDTAHSLEDCTLWVRFQETPQVDEAAKTEGWESREMKGIIKFWFTRESCFMTVED